jgi:hypothetical protein
MIKFELLKGAGLLIVEPREALTVEDFQTISRAVDPYIAENGKLNGKILTIAPKIAEHVAHPELKIFRSEERASALAWLQRV